MKKIVSYLRDYFVTINKPLLLSATLFTALVIFINYHFKVDGAIGKLNHWSQYACWYGVFVLALGYGYVLQAIFLRSPIFKNKKFVALLLIGPAIFAWKMAFSFHLKTATDFFEDDYWNAVLYWPFKVIGIALMLWLVYRFFDADSSFYGVTTKSFTAKPYLIMLCIMIPLIAAASTQKDFLAMYPRYQNIEYLLQPGRGWNKLLYEISYGSDFFSIELFFRGFLVLAFARWAGKEAILPMAIFYCTIHFGKPLGECISSYFGGLILGIVSYHTRTILGGFMVHVGIAWLMEAGGYFGHSFF